MYCQIATNQPIKDYLKIDVKYCSITPSPSTNMPLLVLQLSSSCISSPQWVYPNLRANLQELLIWAFHVAWSLTNSFFYPCFWTQRVSSFNLHLEGVAYGRLTQLQISDFGPLSVCIMLPPAEETERAVNRTKARGRHWKKRTQWCGDERWQVREV